MPGENALQVHSNEQFAKEKPVHAKICWNTFTSPIFFALQIAIPVSFCYTSNHSNATFTCICSVTNHVPTPLNAAPLKSVRCQMLLHLATQKKSSNLVKFSTCQKKNLSTKSKTFFFKQYNKKGKKKSIHYKHNLFCHKQMNNHHNHDNSTPASNVITSKQVLSAPWISRKQQRSASGKALDSRLAHILQANSFFATIFSF